MNKRGGLFYIIDAFIAAAIISLTIVTVLSQSPTVVDDSLQRSFEEYLDFMSSSLSSTGRSPLDTAALLVIQGKVEEAQEYLSTLNAFVMNPQFTVEVVYVNGTNRTVVLSGEGSGGSSRLTSQVMVWAYDPGSSSTYTIDTNTYDGSATGQSACESLIAGSRCAYALFSCDNSVENVSYRLCHESSSPCSDLNAKVIVHPLCVFSSDDILVGPAVMEVSMWVK